MSLFTRYTYTKAKPLLFTLTNLVKVQVGFIVVQVLCQEYAFISKLCSICLFNYIVESVSCLLLYLINDITYNVKELQLI